MKSVSDVAVASVVLVAVELTIKWNRIKGVNDPTKVDQLIPFFLGVFTIMRILYLFFDGRGGDASRRNSGPTGPAGGHRLVAEERALRKPTRRVQSPRQEHSLERIDLPRVIHSCDRPGLDQRPQGDRRLREDSRPRSEERVREQRILW